MFVETCIRFVDVYEYAVVVSYEAEVQILQFFISLYGSALFLCYALCDVVNGIDED